jgi:NAD(P)H-hydrate epimerase
MKGYCTREQVREMDRRAIEEYGMPGIVLMENAGRGAAMAAAAMLGDPAGKRIAVFCGKGNNGGDGFVVARHLFNAGVEVETCLAGRMAEVPPESDAGVNMYVARRMNIPLYEVPDTAAAAALRLTGFDLLVDALLGTGLSGEVREPSQSLIERLNASGRPVLAIDIPSGLCADSGRVLGVAVKAARTATFAAAKRGFFLGDGPARVGQLDVVDIGAPRQLLNGLR